MSEGQGDRKDLISRIGTFFLLIGLGLVILFIASDVGKTTNFGYFFIGIIMLFIGWHFKRITAPPPKPSARFEGIRKIRQRQEEARAKREAARKEKEAKKK
jgi:cytochrome c biogenesis protein CcdA